MNISKYDKICKYAISEECKKVADRSFFKGNYCVECYKTYIKGYYQSHKTQIIEQVMSRYVKRERKPKKHKYTCDTALEEGEYWLEK